MKKPIPHPFLKCPTELISALTEIKGVGVWTAEMLMIFSLAKPNVLSFHDFGIRKAIRHYTFDGAGKNDFERYRTMFCPYGTVASFYLWQFANDNCVI
jgi:DNA-3-methyladenine glycosylase II